MSTTPAQNCILVTLEQGIAVITLNNPPVNALSSAVKQGLSAALETAQANEQVQAIILHGSGRHFCAGADISEFGRTSHPSLSDLCQAIESCTKPVICAITGACLGGGLELALAAHYRLATPLAKLGLPEVNLGLIPGGGGTQRAPRLIGAKAALELMLGGKPLNASQALAEGLVDRLVPADNLHQSALNYAQQARHNPEPLRRTCNEQGLADQVLAAQQIAQAQEKTKRHPDRLAQQNIVAAVSAALHQPFAEGLSTERELFGKCLNSPQRAALVHAFFAEKTCDKIAEQSTATPAKLKRIGVIGAGTMGVGISLALLDGGYEVLLLERDQPALEHGRERISATYQTLVERQRISVEDKNQRLARLITHTDYSVLADADLVIEAVFEDMAVKRALLAKLEACCRTDCIIASNTSYLDIDAMAQDLKHPQRVIGIHFFSPANIMKLVEVVVPSKADARTIVTAFNLAKSLNKTPVRAGLCDGFIGNRMLAVYREAAELMMLDGASPYAIDQAIRDFGFAMGPFEVVDLAGGDISWATRKRKAAQRDPRLRYVSVADQLCERGWFGQKSGRGYYRYSTGSRQGTPDPEVEAIIAQVRSEAGITPKTFSAAEIVERYLAAMINEGANVLAEGIALRPLDVDVVLLNGYGFPRHQGGPMWYADHQGLELVLSNIQRYAKTDPLFWQPSPLLEGLVFDGQYFADLNR
ncbi:3-hydroxyacyl-CoA dehydrogenase NAD-binding domain-containing protein [Pseudomonas sp. 5P_3.1_Bac2]|uniref:3-hydroxyacyl-CoA dehydrogenase NAD-binding domain-containing protein n=1 Tax=Pseudomonas sp. 5P_3.1_Bac2 TaxID=2971617 RepID=UPI0021C8719A|nr:3-hydroxyacyl-CoA dehydrogenase NAD-binding domain-containing protein [Pseudomonas sp. 5P_3.1_Bac2]MCU1719459.1 3-hydroxyacyl-CoA dehydrogenase NAD-binding domain-containing protein [Pseudomonas sp. 5P_3.1_Bac2]